MDEQWQVVVGFDTYEVSSAGRVRNVRSGRVLAGSVTGPGYIHIGLSNGRGRPKYHYVHRLVCTAFHGTPSPELVVNHLNGNKLDNRAANVCWCTRAENNAHAAKMGFLKGRLAGAKNPKAKLTDEQVYEMRRRSRAGTSYTRLAEQFAVSVPTAYRAVVGQTWGHLPQLPIEFRVALAH